MIVTLFLGYSLNSYWKQITINKHITDLKLQYGELVKSISSERIKKIQALTNTDAIYSVLQTMLLKDGAGFTSYLETFSAACPNGLWLTSINIKKRKNSTTLSGKTYHPSNIIQLINNLNNKALFQKKPFFLAKIEKVDEPKIDSGTKPTKIYSFILKTQANAELKI